jgi:hypothetical protein
MKVYIVFNPYSCIKDYDRDFDNIQKFTMLQQLKICSWNLEYDPVKHVKYYFVESFSHVNRFYLIPWSTIACKICHKIWFYEQCNVISHMSLLEVILYFVGGLFNIFDSWFGYEICMSRVNKVKIAFSTLMNTVGLLAWIVMLTFWVEECIYRFQGMTN